MYLFDFGFILITITIYVKDRVKLFLNIDVVGDLKAKCIFYYFRFNFVRTVVLN